MLMAFLSVCNAAHFNAPSIDNKWGGRSIASAKIQSYFAPFTHDQGDQKMKKIILSLAFIAASFSTLTSAETLVNANGVDTFQCTANDKIIFFIF